MDRGSTSYLYLSRNNYERVLYSTYFLKKQKAKSKLYAFKKMYYEKTTTSEKSACKSNSFGWIFGFWKQKHARKAQPNGP
jgi:hypothetical protein